MTAAVTTVTSIEDARRLAEIDHAITTYEPGSRSMLISNLAAQAGISARVIRRLAQAHPDVIEIDTDYSRIQRTHRVRLVAPRPVRRRPPEPLENPPAGFTGDDHRVARCAVCGKPRTRWTLWEGMRIPSDALRKLDRPSRILDVMINGKLIDRETVYAAGSEICKWHATEAVESGERGEVESRERRVESRNASVERTS